MEWLQHFLVFYEEDKCVHQEEELNHAYGKGCKVPKSTHNISGVSVVGHLPVVFDYIDICPCFNSGLLEQDREMTAHFRDQTDNGKKSIDHEYNGLLLHIGMKMNLCTITVEKEAGTVETIH